MSVVPKCLLFQGKIGTMDTGSFHHIPPSGSGSKSYGGYGGYELLDIIGHDKNWNNCMYVNIFTKYGKIRWKLPVSVFPIFPWNHGHMCPWFPKKLHFN